MEGSARTFKLYGVEYELVAPPDFDFGELIDCENLFGARFDSDEMDSRRLASIIYVSVRRKDETFTLATMRKLGRAERDEIDASIREWSQSEDGPADPQAGAAPSSDVAPIEPSSGDEPASNPANDSDAPDGSGPLSSPRSSDSGRPTLIA